MRKSEQMINRHIRDQNSESESIFDEPTFDQLSFISSEGILPQIHEDGLQKIEVAKEAVQEKKAQRSLMDMLCGSISEQEEVSEPDTPCMLSFKFMDANKENIDPRRPFLNS